MIIKTYLNFWHNNNHTDRVLSIGLSIEIQCPIKSVYSWMNNSTNNFIYGLMRLIRIIYVKKLKKKVTFERGGGEQLC